MLHNSILYKFNNDLLEKEDGTKIELRILGLMV